MIKLILNGDPSKATEVIVLISVTAVLITLSVLIFFRVRKNFQKEKEKKQAKVSGTLTWTEMRSLISTYISSPDNKKYYLAYIDMDKFSNFTTVFGAKEGFELINLIAEKILTVLPRKTFLARFKYSHFIAFFPNNYDMEDVNMIANEILNIFRKGLTNFRNVDIDMTSSICVGEYPNHGRTLDLLVESLRLGILQLKRSGGDDVLIYSGRLIQTVRDVEYSRELETAIENKEFRLYYTPAYNLTNNDVEVLITETRWHHPEKGIINPQKFMNYMEETGDILWIGEWGFDSIVRKILQFRDKHKNIPLFSFKVSPKQLTSEKLISYMQKAVKRFKIDPSTIVIEIGEYALFEKDTIIFKNIAELKKIGFKLIVIEFSMEPRNFHILKTLDFHAVGLDFNMFETVLNASEGYFKQLTDFIREEDRILVCTNIDTKEQADIVTKYQVKYASGEYYQTALNGNDILELPLNREG